MATIINKIVDIHNHTFPEVDDGAKTLEEAYANLEYLSKYAEKIVLTSHYIVGSEYTASVSKREEILPALKVKAESLGIELYLGNEVYIADAKILKDLLAKNEIATLNGSRYLLIEFPLRQKLAFLETVLMELNEAGYKPIIAHPERYTYFQDNPRSIEKLLDYDCYLQCNLTSIGGYYGHKAQRTVKKLLKSGIVSFLATDFHHVPKENKIERSLKKLKRVISKDKIRRLLIENPNAVLRNEIIEK